MDNLGIGQRVEVILREMSLGEGTVTYICQTRNDVDKFFDLNHPYLEKFYKVVDENDVVYIVNFEPSGSGGYLRNNLNKLDVVNKEEAPEERKRPDIPTLIATLTNEELLEIGKFTAATDYAVRFFKNRKHPKFYNNRKLLVKTVRRSFHHNFPEKVEYIRETVLELTEDRL